MVLFGDISGMIRAIIQLPPTEVILADSLGWENMDAFTPEDIEDINNSYYKEKAEKEAREAEWEEQRKRMRQSQRDLIDIGRTEDEEIST